ncbi:3 beta-hydroxysteroid dehydrogenase type 7 [Melopsittacus undulatus]|uniref:3 beta-hydroxysteroid dehydrogenase type 7 n=1 Tax=Melopsittacus undulatus TaxID=13146 RepID=UPI00146CAC80|nr:3 beta-hydroxysteroid dehydrogenase type 7 [Melopsittacus undulatus]
MEGERGGGREVSMVYVVTGGCGFLGSHLVQLLLEAEPDLGELRVFDLRPDPDLIPPAHASRVRLLHGDVTDAVAMGQALDGAHVVLHCAALVDVWGRVSPEAIARVNVQGTRTVIAACRAQGVRCLIYTSSMEVVGPNTRGDPFLRGHEDSPYPTRHTEPYSRSKAQAERLVLEANGSRVRGGGQLVTVALRPTGIYGERHPLLERLYLRGCSAGGRLFCFLPERAEHGRVYVGNVAWMHILAARAALSSPCPISGQVFFCYDSSPPLPYEELSAVVLGLRYHRGALVPPVGLLRLLAALSALLARVLPHRAPLLTPATLAMGSTPFTVRTDKANRVFGYKPLYTWEEAKERTREWAKGLKGS